MKQSIGFIGGGRITRIFLKAFQNKHTSFSKVVVAETNSEVAGKLKTAFPEIILNDASVAASQDIVFIALHPPVIMDTMELIRNSFINDAIIISLAPKISLEKMSSKVPQSGNVARLIPNATSYINQGYNPVCFSGGFQESAKQEILPLLQLLGSTFEVPEIKLESYAILSAMLPTYFWFQWKALEEIGQKTGMNDKEAAVSIYETLIASLDLMYKSGLTAAEVMDLIPVKPIFENEQQITDIFNHKLIGLYEKIKP
jgi:pyrroline-5-carboxylate reductase